MFRLFKQLIKRKKFKRIMINISSCIFVFSLLYFVAGKFAVRFLGEQQNLNYFDALYFSFVTQSTVGYGDIVPTNILTKSITMLQLLSVIAIIGAELR